LSGEILSLKRKREQLIRFHEEIERASDHHPSITTTMSIIRRGKWKVKRLSFRVKKRFISRSSSGAALESDVFLKFSARHLNGKRECFRKERDLISGNPIFILKILSLIFYKTQQWDQEGPRSNVIEDFK
jgi:hypothetical protein